MSYSIYLITNTATGVVYIGYAGKWKERCLRHFSELRRNRHSNILLQAAFNTHGESAFHRQCIEDDIMTLDLALEAEAAWIAAFPNVYNVSKRSGAIRRPHTKRKQPRLSDSIVSRTVVTCPHCGKSGQALVFGRYHFGKCNNRK